MEAIDKDIFQLFFPPSLSSLFFYECKQIAYAHCCHFIKKKTKRTAAPEEQPETDDTKCTHEVINVKLVGKTLMHTQTKIA